MGIWSVLHFLVFLICTIHGKRLEKFDSTQRIVNGNSASKGKFPVITSLRLIANGKHFCGGTILTKKWILTAAHCCEKLTPAELFVTSGTVYLDRKGTNRTVEEIISHKGYDEKIPNEHDICVIRVKEPFIYNKYVQQVILPDKDFPVNPGDELTAAGWGKIDQAGKEAPNRLQASNDFILVSNDVCGKEGNVTTYPGFICIRGTKKGLAVCFGDSGGPVFKNKVQIGLTSWSFRPCTYPAPTFYISTAYYIDWIKEKLGADAADIKFTRHS